MSDVKWIKIATNIFDDEKILIIEKLPNADSIIVIWFKLLTLAGKQNNSGVFIMNNRIAYTDEMLSAIFRRDLNLVKMALATFQAYGMIEIIEGTLTIPNWSKHQTLDKLAAKTEYQKKYMQEYRKKQKQIVCKSNSKTNVNQIEDFSNANVSEIDKELDKDIDKDIDKELLQEEKSSCDGSLQLKDVLLTYENEVGLISPTIKETFESYLNDITAELMILAIKTAVKSNARRLSYIEGILRNWVNDSVHTVDELKAKEIERNSSPKYIPTKSAQTKVEKFNSMASHDWDFDELEKLQREHITEMLKKEGKQHE